MATKKCQICGENSGIYPLCYKHLQEKSKGLIKKCEKCQKWHYTNESCECKIKKQKNETKVKKQNSTYKKIETPNSMSKNTNNNGQGKCILCGKTANNYFFCSECYIEHWGYDENNIKYTKTKKYKIPKYKELGITLICTNEKNDMKDIYTALSRKLKYYKSNTINFNED